MNRAVVETARSGRQWLTDRRGHLLFCVVNLRFEEIPVRIARCRLNININVLVWCRLICGIPRSVSPQGCEAAFQFDVFLSGQHDLFD